MDNTGVLKNDRLLTDQNLDSSELSDNPWLIQMLQSNENKDAPILEIRMKVYNKNQEYIGSLIANLDIKAIIQRLNEISESNPVNVTLVDDKFNLILSSSEKFIKQNDMEKIKFPITFLGEDGVTSRLQILNDPDSKQIHLESISYFKNLYYKKIKYFSLSYIILINFDVPQLQSEIHQKTFPKLYGFIFTGLFCMVVLYFFRKRIITPLSKLSEYAILISEGKTNVKIPDQNSLEMINLAKSLTLVQHYIKKTEIYKKKLELANETIKKSSDEMEDFVKSINKELMTHLKDILICTEILLQEKSDKKQMVFDSANTIKYLEKIRESAINIKNKTSDSLNLIHFDFNQILNQAIQINLKHSSLKNIDIICSLPETQACTYGDSLKLKQVLVGLIFQAIENSTENEKIIISSNIYANQNNAYVRITIKDHGFGLSEEELQRVKNNIGWHKEDYLFTDIDIKFVKKVVKIHQGEFHVSNKLHKGRTVFLKFPLLTEKDFSLTTEKSNIYYLHPEVL